MTKYGRIHTDGSLDDSQPTQGYGVVTAANYTSPIGGAGTGLQTVVIREGMAACTDRIGGACVVTHGAVGVATQSDALRDQLLHECLVKLRDVQGTEAPKQYACNLIKRVERVLQGQAIRQSQTDALKIAREAFERIKNRKWNTLTQGCDAAVEAALIARDTLAELDKLK